jgi:chemotaxis protein histidine kinase CheA
MSEQDHDAGILALFQVEAAEHIALLNTELLVVERDPSLRADALRKVLRAAHSLKGTAAAAGLTRVEQWMHNWESCAQAVARGDAEPSAEVLDLLYQLLDAVEGEVQFACTGFRAEGAISPPGIATLRRTFGEELQLIDLASHAMPEPRAALDVGAPRPEDRGVLRVAAAKVDQLMAGVDELVQVKAGGSQLLAELAQLEAALQSLGRELQVRSRKQRAASGAAPGQHAADLPALQKQAEYSADLCSRIALGARHQSHVLSVLATRLQQDVRAVRMVPVRSLFAPFSRMVRDLARRQNKRAVLRIEGADTEVDRDLLEALRDPIMHLLRNAVAHGLEAPEVRARAGKPEEGLITLAISSGASGLDIRVSDDGGGIDGERIRAVLIKSQVMSHADAAALGDAELERFLFQPGFSTAAAVDAVSGRGVGLDVVREAVERCGGTVRLVNQHGHGVTFELRLPLSLTAMRVLVVRASHAVLAVPVNNIVRVVRIERSAVRQVDSGPAIELDGNAVPLRSLGAALGLDAPASPRERVPAVVVEAAGERCALTVDAIDGEQEFVILSLGEYLQHLPSVSGAAVLGTGEIVPTLNVAAIVREMVSGASSARVFAPESASRAERKRVLIVDDSITTRTLERSILEAVGYAVEVATDGQDALAKLRAQHFDLVLSDVQMPRMDGIELVTRLRSDQALRSLKVVLVSSLAADDDRKRGLTAGADAYIGKGEFRQELLLQTLGRLL